MNIVLIFVGIFALSADAQLSFGSDGIGFSNRLFNTSFSPPRWTVSLGSPQISQVRQALVNPITNLFKNTKQIGNAIQSSVNSEIHTAYKDALNTVVRNTNQWKSVINNVPFFGNILAGINGTMSSINFQKMWNSLQTAINNFSNGHVTNPTSVFDQMNQFMPHLTKALIQMENYSKTATNPEVWKRFPANIRNRISNMANEIADVTSAINRVIENIPQFAFDKPLNTTLRNKPFFFSGRSVIVHLFEWKFADIAIECEQVLAPNGYGGVQVSPINEYLVSANRPWWERYQPISYKINSRSGDEKQFADMVQRCQRVGIRVYVDIVVNHMAAPGKSVPLYGTSGSTCDPLARAYPAVPFNKSHFHAECVISNYNNATNVRDCELSTLPDLDQSNEYVRERIVEFMNHLLDLGVAGFRMDACKHMWPKDLEVIYSSLKTVNPLYYYPPQAKPFIYQEVIDLGNEAVSVDEYTGLGVVTEFKWGIILGGIFRGNLPLNTLLLLNKNGSAGLLMPSSQALVFVDNHDNQRGHGAGGAAILTYKNKPQYIQAVAFTLATDYGIARIMSSYEFDDSDQGPPQDSLQVIKFPGPTNGACINGWVCEHRWPEVQRMVHFKNFVGEAPVDHIQSTDVTFAFCRGDKGFIVFNSSADRISQTFHTCLESGSYCDIISGKEENGVCTGNTIRVDKNGDATITVAPNSVVAIYGLSKIL